jgi:hypothetical protein
MKKYPFELKSDEDLILLPVKINDYEVILAIDTASTQTIIDFNILLMLGYRASDSTGIFKVETANGIMETQQFRLKKLSAFDKKISDFDVLSYDFLQKGIVSAYEGVLGLDFFRGLGVLTIDFKKQEIWFE